MIHLESMDGSIEELYRSLPLEIVLALAMQSNASGKHRFYFHLCYSYSQVKSTVDRQHGIVLNQTHQLRKHYHVAQTLAYATGQQ